MTQAFVLQAQQTARRLLVVFLFVLPFSNAAIEILFPFLLVAWFVGWPLAREGGVSVWPSFPARVVSFALFSYLGVCAVSVLTSNNVTLSVSGMVTKTLEYAMLFFIASDIVSEPKVLQRGIQSLLAAAWLVVLYAVLQEWLVSQVVPPALALDPIRGRPLIYGRMIGPYNNPNDLATFLMVTSLLAIALLLKQKNRAILPTRILCALLLGSLAWTHSRGALLGWLGGFLFLLFSLAGRRKRVWASASVAMAVITLLLFFRKGHFLDSLAFADPGSQERLLWWSAALRMILAHPILGVGLNTFMFNYNTYVQNPHLWPAYAHNCFLQIAAETGILGLITFLVFLTALALFTGKALKRGLAQQEETVTAELAGLTGALLAFLLQSGLDTNLYVLRQAVLFWTLSGVAFGMGMVLLREGSAPPHA